MKTKISHKPPTFFTLFIRELKHDYFALISAVTLIILLLAIFIGTPIITSRYDVMWITPSQFPVSPSESGTVLGLDRMGRDQFHLLFVAARNSLYLSFAITSLSFLIGIPIGIISGFYGGKIDNIVMRVTDTWSMVPFLMIVIVLLTVFSRTVFTFILFFSLFMWAPRARLLRAATLAQKQQDYINASKTLGTPNFLIMVREIFPNLVDVTVANFVLIQAATIGIETGLSLLGYGLGWDYPSLGVMVGNARIPLNLQHFPWVWMPAMVLVIVLMLCVNFVGNALQRVSDPRQRYA